MTQFNSLTLTLLLLLVYLQACLARLHYANKTLFSDWSPASGSDVRSPCPGLNTLANHCILPHSGKGITMLMLQAALSSTFNIAQDFTSETFTDALATSPDPLLGSLDLDDLNEHNVIEHDGSLSRADYHDGGDDHTFNQTIFDTVLAYFGNDTHATISTAAKARDHRIVTQKIRNSEFVYSQKTGLLSYGETALYLSALGDPETGVTPVKYIKILFEQERLPFNEGWRRPNTPITLQTIRSMIQRIVAATANVTQTTGNGTNAIRNSTQTTANSTQVTANVTDQNPATTTNTTIHKPALLRNLL